MFQAHSKTAEKQPEEEEKEKVPSRGLQKEEEDLKVLHRVLHANIHRARSLKVHESCARNFSGKNYSL